MIRIKKLVLIVLFLFPISLSSFKVKETTFFNSFESEKEKDVIVHIKDLDLYLDLEDYVLGVVSAEMPALFSYEALKAQAVASRSFAMSKEKSGMIEISSTISDQVYHANYQLFDKWNSEYNNYYEKIKNSILSTKGEVVTRNGEILRTYYFSMSNGKTENSLSVFNEPTFLSVDSPYENNLKNFEVSKEISENDIKNILKLENIDIQSIKRNDTNHVESIIISGKVFNGTEIRKLLKLRSTDFDIVKSGDSYIISTRGYGHGVGMSQYGANEMAKRGYSYQEILKHYYQNTNLTKI